MRIPSQVKEKFLQKTPFLARFRLQKFFFWLGMYLIVTLILLVNLGRPVASLKVGDVAHQDIYAPKTITYFDFESNREKGIEEVIAQFAKLIETHRKTGKPLPEMLVIDDKKKLVSRETIAWLVNCDEEKWTKLKESLILLLVPLEKVARSGETTESLLNDLKAKISHLGYPDDVKAVVNEIALFLAEFLPRMKVIKKDEVIIRTGEVVNAEDVYVLKQLNSWQSKSAIRVNFFGGCLITFLMMLFCIFFFTRFKPEVLENDSMMLLWGIIVTITLILVKFVLLLSKANIYLLQDIRLISEFLVPIPAASMLLFILFSPDLAILTTVILCILTGLMVESGMNVAVVAFFGGLVGIYCVSRLNRRSEIARSGLYISLSNVALVFALYLFQTDTYNPFISKLILRDASWGFINGIFCTILTIGGLPYLENFFKITTTTKLLELSNLDQPLMQELLMKAPGTYHHSMVVAHLAESAAELIGASSLLCKIGAYYHDIGKLKRPYFFVENQIGLENPHDGLSPNLSALIIISHVKDGIEMAKKNGLPEPIIDIIAQHHGNSLISYFYHLAKEKEAETNETVTQENFRYPGPLPSSKEAALIMLADAIESATRTIKKPNPTNLKGMVEKITRSKFEDGQLNECNITLKDIEKINKNFVQILAGMFHSRIEYPKEALSSE